MCNHMMRTRTCYGEPVEVPCGSCVTCLRTKRTFFCHRIQSDVAYADARGFGSSFATLTVDDDHLTGTGVDKRKLQLFHKRLRKDGHEFTYLAIGDYGEHTAREHYHGIYIGLDPVVARPAFQKHWHDGFVDLDPVTSGNISYVVRYVYGQTRQYKEFYEENGYGAPFTLFSRGLGATLFQNNLDEILTKGKYFWSGKWYTVPQYWLAKFGKVKPKGFVDSLRQDAILAERYGFQSAMEYRDWRSRQAEFSETRRYQQKLKPPQGIRHEYQNLTPRRPIVPVDVDTIFSEE